LMLGQVEAAMQGRDEGGRLPRKQRKRVIVQVEMEDVEMVGSAPDLLQHRHVQSHRIPHRTVEAKRPRPDRFEASGGVGIAAGEQGHVVPEGDEFLGQPRNNPLSTTVQLRGYGLGQRRYLRDTHAYSWCRSPSPAELRARKMLESDAGRSV